MDIEDSRNSLGIAEVLNASHSYVKLLIIEMLLSDGKEPEKSMVLIPYSVNGFPHFIKSYVVTRDQHTKLIQIYKQRKET